MIKVTQKGNIDAIFRLDEAVKELDRATDNMVEMAKDKDIVLLLGKGREVYQKLEFNDITVAYQEIALRKINEEKNANA